MNSILIIGAIIAGTIIVMLAIFKIIELLGDMSHGEAVGLGMLYVIKDETLKEKVKECLNKLGLRSPT